MSRSPFDPYFEDLPETLPIFPLEGIVLLPGGDLPLNIFEPRYLAMVADCLCNNRMIGMVQPFSARDIMCDESGRCTVFRTGCAGRITQFTETEDGRYMITLRGVCRFNVVQELALAGGGYRRVEADWSPFRQDMDPPQAVEMDRRNLCALLRHYFDVQEITLDWPLLHEVEDDELLMAMLAMICPFTPLEKQALLEAPCCNSRANLLISLLEMSVGGSPSDSSH